MGEVSTRELTQRTNTNKTLHIQKAGERLNQFLGSLEHSTQGIAMSIESPPNQSIVGCIICFNSFSLVRAAIDYM